MKLSKITDSRGSLSEHVELSNNTLRVSLKGLFSNTDSFAKDMCRPYTALGFGNEVGVS
jgi:hypothetical protein